MKFSEVSDKLCIKTPQQQEALLKLLSYKGYFGEINKNPSKEYIAEKLNVDRKRDFGSESKEMIKFLQQNFLRSLEMENQVLKDFEPGEERDFLLEQFKILGLVKEQIPNFEKKLPTVVFIQGDEEKVMLERIKFFEEHYKLTDTSNIKKIIPMSSDRQAWPIREESVIKMLIEQRNFDHNNEALLKDHISIIKGIINKNFTPDLINDIQNKFPELLKARQNCINELKSIGIEWPIESRIFNRLLKNFEFDDKVSKAICATRADGKRPNVVDCLRTLLDNKLIDEIKALSDINIIIVTSQPQSHYQLNSYTQYLMPILSLKLDQIQILASEYKEPNVSVLFDSLGRKICISVELAKALDEQKTNSTNFLNLVRSSTPKEGKSFG